MIIRPQTIRDGNLMRSNDLIPGRHVRTKQDPRVCVTVLEEGGGPLGLLLLAVDAHHGQVDVARGGT